MLTDIRNAATDYCDGLVTQREFLTRLIDLLAREWSKSGEDEWVDTDDTATLAKYLSGL